MPHRLTPLSNALKRWGPGGHCPLAGSRGRALAFLPSRCSHDPGLRRPRRLGCGAAGAARARACRPVAACVSRRCAHAPGSPRRWRSSRRTPSVLRFPAWDCLPYDRVSPNPELVSERIATLARLLEKPAGPRIVLTTVNALVQRVPPRHVFHGASLSLAEGGTVDPDRLVRFLDANGYGRAGTVMEPGEYAVRGGIVDVFPAGRREPVRLDLFGDTIESIRAFDPASQRSGARLKLVVLRPVSEVFLDKASVARFRTGWRELFGQAAGERPDLSVGLRGAAPSRHGALGAAVPPGHGDAARLSARRFVQPGPPGRGRAGGPAGNDRRPLRGPPRAAARGRGAVPAVAAGRGCISTAPAGMRCWPACRCSASGRSPGRRGRPASMAAAVRGRCSPRPGRRAGCERVRPVARPGRALDRRGAAHRRRRLDPRLARPHRPSAARARVPRRARR